MWKLSIDDYIHEVGSGGSCTEMKRIWKIMQDQAKQVNILQKYKQKISELVNKLKKIKNQNQYLKIQNQKLQQELYSATTHKVQAEQKIKQMIEQHKANQLKKNAITEQLYIQMQQSIACKTNVLTQQIRQQQQKIQKYEQKLKQQEKQLKSSTNNRDINLILQRQSETLKQQDKQCKKLSHENQILHEELQILKEELYKKQNRRVENQQHVQQMNENMLKLMTKIDKQSSDWETIRQVQQIRRNMREKAKYQVQLIEDLISEI